MDTSTIDINAVQLKNKLQFIKNGSWHFTDSDIYLDMLAHIGSADSVLRDDLIYQGFYHLLNKDVLSKKQMFDLLSEILKLIMYKIGNRDQSIFTRTFAMLVLVEIIKKDTTEDFLSDEQLNDIFYRLIDYIGKEQDLRGYIKEMGWAHALAHCSDAVDAVVRHSKFSASQKILLGKALLEKICDRHYIYSHSEDERVATPVIGLIRFGMLSLDDIVNLFDAIHDDEITHENLIMTNKKVFLRTLYFRLRHHGYESTDIDILVEEANKITPWFYEV